MTAIRHAANEIFPKLQLQRPTMEVGKIGRGQTNEGNAASSTLSHLEGAQRRLGAGTMT